MAFVVLNGEQVREHLPMSECVEVMADAMAAASAGEVEVPVRQWCHPTAIPEHHFGLMPGGSRHLGVYGVKLLTLHEDNSQNNLPSIHGLVVLFDANNGIPQISMDGAVVTEIRTAAVSGLATRLLARPDARSCGIFGTGVQAAAHIQAMLVARDIQTFKIWGRDFSKAQQFAEEQCAITGCSVVAVESPADAAGCDVLCAVTASAEPVIQSEWVRPGTHINLVGAYQPHTREADTALIQRARVFFDLKSAAAVEAGDILIPLKEGAITEQQLAGEIGALVKNDIEGRQSDDQVTVYKSVGVFAQDLYAAHHILEKVKNG